jgi:hypothetical protein
MCSLKALRSGRGNGNQLEHIERDFTIAASGCVLVSCIERGGHEMRSEASSFGLVRTPAAFVPMAMSAMALGVVAVAAILGRLVPQSDEGAEAHLWQLLMAGQLPLGIFCDEVVAPDCQTSYVCACPASCRLNGGFDPGVFSALVAEIERT